jgi:hypothetical protein
MSLDSLAPELRPTNSYIFTTFLTKIIKAKKVEYVQVEKYMGGPTIYLIIP